MIGWTSGSPYKMAVISNSNNSSSAVNGGSSGLPAPAAPAAPHSLVMSAASQGLHVYPPHPTFGFNYNYNIAAATGSYTQFSQFFHGR